MVVMFKVDFDKTAPANEKQLFYPDVYLGKQCGTYWQKKKSIECDIISKYYQLVN